MSNSVEEGKIVSKIDKIFKQIDPNSKKQITELSENIEFRKNVEAIKEYLKLYLGNSDFPKEVYDKAEKLTVFCNEEYRKLVEKKVELEVQAKKNIELSKVLNEVYLFAITREDFSSYVKTLNDNGLEEVVLKLETLAKADRKSEQYVQCEKAIKSKINNLETNLHIDIDLDRITDKEKALSYISIELDNVLSKLTNCVELIVEVVVPDPIIPVELVESYVPDYSLYGEYLDDSLVLIKNDVWSKFVNSKFITRIKELFAGSNAKALNAGIDNAKTQ